MEALTVDLSDLDRDELLRHWRWLVPDSFRLLFATALGDLFLVDDLDRIHWLDVGGAALSLVAESEATFDTILQDEENYNYWLGPSLVGACEEAGMKRGPEDCFSYVMLPMMGGEFKPDNFKVRSLRGHLDGWGPICEQLSKFPDGARVRLTVKK